LIGESEAGDRAAPPAVDEEYDAVADAVAGARLAGHEFDADTVDRLHQVAAGARSVDDAVADVVAHYRRRG
jgi:hypothetical protein